MRTYIDSWRFFNINTSGGDRSFGATWLFGVVRKFRGSSISENARGRQTGLKEKERVAIQPARFLL